MARRVLARVLARVLTPGSEDGEELPPATWLNGKEKAAAFEQWAQGHRDTLPFSDEAISRASMYPDRGF